MTLFLTSLLSLATVATAQTAFAAPWPISCSNGPLGQDTHLSVTLYERRIDFAPHESSFTVGAAEFVENGFTRAVMSKNIIVTSEGVEEAKAVNALLIYNPRRKTLKVSLSLNNEPPTVATLTCDK